MIEAEFPEKLAFLFEPHRYKVAYGGRGGAKSWNFARALLLIGAGKIPGFHIQPPIRVLCARELQKSISESVLQLLKDQISVLGLDDFYEVTKTYIKGLNGTEFHFEGIRSNVKKIKSYEGVDICWVEEADAVRKSSWSVLIPTVRKPGSEIWISFNPDLETDETFQRFIPEKNRPKQLPPNDCHVVKLTYRDNPWFPKELEMERQTLKSMDEDEYLNVWEGECRKQLAGAVYAKELRLARLEGRILHVPYQSVKPVETFWDLGRADGTAIWFAQKIGFEFHIIDYYENQGEHLEHYLKVLAGKKYLYGTLWLPHDAKAKTLGTKRTVQEQCRDVYTTRLVPNLSIADGISAARSIFGQCYFDEERCADGLQALEHYRYEVDQDTKLFSDNPLHDWASQGADAFRYLGIGLRNRKKKADAPTEDSLWGQITNSIAANGTGWMG